MQAIWLKNDPNDNADTLIVLALGWAASDEMVRHLRRPLNTDGRPADLLCLFDYRQLQAIDPLPIEQYSKRYLVGWSFGVWAADTLFNGQPVDWTDTIAVNGTPAGIDEKYGIQPRAFAVTVQSIRRAGTLRFLQRMCGDEQTFKCYMEYRSTRPLGEIGEELESIGRQIEENPRQITGESLWNRALVGARDQIVPPQAMTEYWQDAGIPYTIDEQLPHYPFYDSDLLLKLLSRETR